MKSRLKTLSAAFMFLAALALAYFTLMYVDGIGRDLQQTRAELAAQRAEYRRVKAATDALQASYNLAAADRDNGISAYILLRNTIYEDQNFARLANKHVFQSCPEDRSFDCALFSRYRDLLNAYHTAILVRLNSTRPNEFRSLIGRYEEVLKISSDLSTKFAKRPAERVDASALAEVASSDLETETVASNQPSAAAPSAQGDASGDREPGFVWHASYAQIYSAIGNEGIAYAYWKLADLKNARRYIEKALSHRIVDPRPVLTSLKISCSEKMAPARITASLTSLTSSLKERIKANKDPAGSQLYLDYVQNDFELYRVCNLPKPE